MSEEDKMFFEKFILNNSFDFKQGIINHCRTMDKLDVYEWVAEDELKINNLTKENQELKKQLEEYKRLGFKHLNDKCNKLENQQKEFINWLIENESLDDYCNETTFTYIREKYEEIIGENKDE
ncbi:MAG: hypothetical protein J6D28_04535 [Bacilli bacterium]|nr:hypothetical protein [Bacilli bacterium]